MILLIDNYDSFTYNLYQYISELGACVEVIRNNEIDIEEITAMAPDKIVLSPGPGTPDNAGISNDVIRSFGSTTPILGVCLGHQCVGYTYGGEVGNAGEILHGKTSMINHDGKGIFRGLPNPFEAIRYHSLAVYKNDLPEELEITAWTESGVLMGVRHRIHPVEGIQFHPESIMTKVGKDILQNFLDL